MKKLAALLLPAALGLAACSSPASTDGAGGDGDKPTVVVAFYGLEYTAKQIVGDAADVQTLTAPGQEAHGLELKPSQVADIGKADLVMYLHQFQPAVDEAVEQSGNEHVLDVAKTVELLPASEQGHDHDHGEEGHDHSEEGHDDHAEEGHDHGEEGHDEHDHGDHDPHYWLDPERMAEVGTAMATQLGEQYPDLKDTFTENAKTFAKEMTTLDEEYRAGLTSCDRKAFITAHAAFNYLAHEYGLTEIGISGINPDAEPSPARIAEVQELAKEHHVTTIFFETLTSPAVSKAIAGDLGLKTAVLDPLEGVTDKSPGDDYPSIMRANLKALKEANGCH